MVLGIPFSSLYVGRMLEPFSPPTRVSGSVNMAYRPQTRNSIVFFGLLCNRVLHSSATVGCDPELHRINPGPFPPPLLESATAMPFSLASAAACRHADLSRIIHLVFTCKQMMPE